MKIKIAMRLVIGFLTWISCTVLLADSKLDSGESFGLTGNISSEDSFPRGRKQLGFDSTGNLILQSFGFVRWDAGIADRGAQAATMRIDGNFVVTDESNTIVWESNTSGFPGASLQFDDFGDLNIFHHGRPIWKATRGRIEQNISGAGAPHKSIGDRLAAGAELKRGEMLQFSGIGAPLFLKLSPDGSLGLYGPGDTMLSWKAPAPAAVSLLMNEDGNLNLLGDNGEVVWTAGNNVAGSSAVLGPIDFSLVTPKSIAIWAATKGLIQTNITGYGAWHRSRGNRLRAGDVLRQGEMIVNQTGGAPASLRLSKDGTVGVFGPGNNVMWRPQKRNGKVSSIVMDTAGNLVMKSSSDRVLWSASGGSGASALIDTWSLRLQRADQSVAWSSESGVQLSGSRLVSGQVIWGPWRLERGKQHHPDSWVSSRWSPRGPYGVRMILGNDGELELRQDYRNKLLWSAGTKGTKPVRTTFNAGQLSLFDADDKKIYSLQQPRYPNAELQLGGEGENAGARIVSATGTNVWTKGDPFPKRRYRVQWDDIYINKYADGGDGTAAIFGSVTVSTVGSLSRASGHSNSFWSRTDRSGARVKLGEKKSYASTYKGEFANKFQEFVIGPGPKGNYAAVNTQGVKVSVDLWDYDKWSANDHVGTVEKTVYLKEFETQGWNRGEKAINVTGEGVDADFKFKFIRKN